MTRAVIDISSGSGTNSSLMCGSVLSSFRLFCEDKKVSRILFFVFIFFLPPIISLIN